MIHQALVYIIGESYGQALQLLAEGEEINRQSGDRRRTATAQCYQGITYWRLGDRARAMRLIDAATVTHYKLRDWRNLIHDALAGAWVSGYRTAELAVAGALHHGDEAWATVLLDRDSGRALETFGNYWSSNVGPLLMGRTI